jgi:hypothetical protein
MNPCLQQEGDRQEPDNYRPNLEVENSDNRALMKDQKKYHLQTPKQIVSHLQIAGLHRYLLTSYKLHQLQQAKKPHRLNYLIAHK